MCIRCCSFCQRVQRGLNEATFEQKRQLIELLIDRVVVTDEEVEIRYAIPTSLKGESVRFCHVRLDYFNEPVVSYRMGKRCGVRKTQQRIPGLLRDRLAQVTFGLHHSNAAHPFPTLLGVSIRQILHIGHGPLASDLQTTVPCMYRLMKLLLHVSKLFCLDQNTGLLDLVIQGALILFERQRIVSLLIDDLGRNLGLRPHRITGDKASGQDELPQKLRDRDHLVGLLFGG